MSNGFAHSRKWTEFIASRPEFRPGQALAEQFAAGEVTRLCDCGCNSYDFRLPPGAGVAPLAPPSEHGGCAFELEFQTSERSKTVSFTLFLDKDGNLAGLDVDYCANSFPMPQHVDLVEPPFHVHGELANEAEPSVATDAARRG